MAGASWADAFLRLVTESMEERLELLACPPRLIIEAVLDLRLFTSEASEVFDPPMMAMGVLLVLAEVPLLNAGLTCEAPLRYERCAQSLVGEGGRREGPWGAVSGGSGSGDVAMGGGVRIGGRSLDSAMESAWKNLDSEGALPREDEGGDGTLWDGLSSCRPSA